MLLRYHQLKSEIDALRTAQTFHWRKSRSKEIYRLQDERLGIALALWDKGIRKVSSFSLI